MCRVVAITAAALLFVPGVVQADAAVQVQVSDPLGRPVDGTVTLTRPGVTRRCRTVAGRCSMRVPGGSYTATLAPVRGAAPPPRVVVVPPDGPVTLSLRALDAVVATAPSTSVPGLAPAETTRTPPSSSTGGSPTVIDPRTTESAPVTPPPTTRPAPDRPAPGGLRMTIRDLSTGSRLVAQGSVVDAAGRPVDATLTISGQGVSGRVRTTAGRFSVFDLPNGTYAVSIQTVRGTTARASLTVTGGVSRLTLRVP
jgi:hypothetical protein